MLCRDQILVLTVSIYYRMDARLVVLRSRKLWLLEDEEGGKTDFFPQTLRRRQSNMSLTVQEALCKILELYKLMGDHIYPVYDQTAIDEIKVKIDAASQVYREEMIRLYMEETELTEN